MKKQNDIFLWFAAAALLLSACAGSPKQEQPIRDYQLCYEACPEAAYPAEAWLSADGRLDFPFALEEPLPNASRDEMFARFYIPEDALQQAETTDLLRLVKLYPRSGLTAYYLYNYPSHYLDYVTQTFNAVDALYGRKDFAGTLLQVYTAEEMLPMHSFDDKEEQTAYDKERNACANGIMLLEIMLAQDAVFEELSDGQRRQVLEAVLAKDTIRENDGGYGRCSGFFASVKELHEAGGSKWYDYIAESGPEWTVYLDEYWESHYWP